MNFKKLILCISAMPTIFVGGLRAVEANAVETGFLISSEEYTGSLILNNLTVENGYCAIPINEQGDNNWFAAYGSAMGVYAKMPFGDSSHGTNYFQGPNQYNNIWWRQEFGPDGGDDAISVWRAPYNGTVRFSGKIVKNNMTGSDGVVISVVNKKSRGSDSSLVQSETCTSAFTLVIDQTVDVISGEMYLFSVGQNGSSSYDQTKVYIKADFTEAAEKGEHTTGTDIEPTNFETEGFLIEKEKYGGSIDLSQVTAGNGYLCSPVTHGVGEWFAAYGNPTAAYAKMTDNDDTHQGNHWQGSAQYNSVWWREEFAPDGGDDAIALWRAPYNGTVKFEGKIYKSDILSGSDGVTVSVYNKKSRSAETTLVIEKERTENFILVVDQEVNVISGEMYMFSVNQLGTSAYDTTHLLIKATFTEAAEKGEHTTGTDIEPIIDPGKVDFLTEEQYYVLGPENEYLATPKSEQGENNFYAIRGDAAGTYYYMKSFEESESTHWRGSAQYNSIYWQQNYYPDGGDDAILLWKAPYNGTVKFEGKVYKNDFTGSDGVRILAHHKQNAKSSAEVLVDREFHTSFALFFNGATYNVKAGELFIVSVDQFDNSAYDEVKVLCKATYVKDELNPGEYAEDTGALTDDIDYLSYFGTTQGHNDWFYTYGTIEKKVLMTYGCSKNSGNYQWNGFEDWAGILAGNMTPGNKTAVMRNFVCRYDGKLSLRGSVVKNTPGGDGADVKFYYNDKVLKSALLTDDSAVLDLGTEFESLEVKAGDIITYYVGSGANQSNDCDNITFKSEIKYLEKNTETEIKDLLSVLKPVSRAEFLGITLVDPNLDQNEDYFANPNQGLYIGIIIGGSALIVAAAVTIIIVIVRRRKIHENK